MDNMEIDKNDEVYFEITDEDGVEHKVKLLTIFKAGDLNKEYAAVLSTDLQVFRCIRQRGENTYDIEDTYTDEYEEITADLDDILSDLDEDQVKEGKFFTPESDEPVYGSIFGIWENAKYKRKYIAVQPHDVMFFRYETNGSGDDTTISLSQIYSPKEEEDVRLEFQKNVTD